MRLSSVTLASLLAISVPLSTFGATCTNGVTGVQSKLACCVEECGSCGGSGCSSRVPGLGEDDCCEGDILNDGVACSVSEEAPCIIGDEMLTPVSPTPASPTESPTPDPGLSTCTNGFVGVSRGDICCVEGCGTCGGSQCGSRVEGLSSSDCCMGKITDNGVTCSDAGEAPCIMDNEAPTPVSPTPAPPTPASPTASPTESPTPDPGLSTCTNGFVGVSKSDICCVEGCGTCGGSQCGSRVEGLSSSDCCMGKITDNGVTCSDAGKAPCIMGTLPPTPSPTVVPTLPPTPPPVVGVTLPPTPPPTVVPTLPPTPPPVFEDPCDPNPCLNEGSCAADVGGGHICTCATGYGGMACQTDTSDLSPFFILVEYIGDWTPAQKAVFTSAADRWEEVITHVPCGGTTIFPAGRLLITASLDNIDGRGGILGSAGPMRVWANCPAISPLGQIIFDSADIADLEANGTLEGAILHEMGHVIGIGTLWGPNFAGCNVCARDGDPAWTCPAAIEVYQDLGGVDANIMELDGGNGTSCGHLDEDIFNDELMTGLVNFDMPLSKVTAAILDDMDYTVDPSAVDPYTLPSRRSEPPADELPAGTTVNDVAVEATIIVMDEDGNESELPGIVMQF